MRNPSTPSVLFAVGLGMLSGTQMGGEDEHLPAGYEVRRALRALPLLAIVTGALYLDLLRRLDIRK